MPAVQRLAFESKARPSVLSTYASLAVLAPDAAFFIEPEMVLGVEVHRPLHDCVEEVAVAVHLLLPVLFQQGLVALEVGSLLNAVCFVHCSVFPKASLKMV